MGPRPAGELAFCSIEGLLEVFYSGFSAFCSKVPLEAISKKPDNIVLPTAVCSNVPLMEDNVQEDLTAGGPLELDDEGTMVEIEILKQRLARPVG